MMHFIVNLYQCSEHWTVDVMPTTHLMEIALYVHLKSCKIHVLRAQIGRSKMNQIIKKFFSVSISIIKPDASGKSTKGLHYISLQTYRFHK